MVALLAFLVGFAVFTGLVLLRGVVLVDLWHWFMTPFGLPQIGVIHAIGLSLLISFLVYRSDLTTKEMKFAPALIGGLIFTLSIWGIGYLIHLFQ
jgi:hypothetical protein